MALQETSSLRTVFLDFFDVKNLNVVNLFNNGLISKIFWHFYLAAKTKLKLFTELKQKKIISFGLQIYIFTVVLFFLHVREPVEQQTGLFFYY